jgi:hypothetical protein
MAARILSVGYCKLQTILRQTQHQTKQGHLVTMSTNSNYIIVLSLSWMLYKKK